MRTPPNIVIAPEEYDAEGENDFREQVRMAFEQLRPAKNAWTVTNGTATRSLDATAASLGELRQVVATMLTDLTSIGSFKTRV